MPGEKTGIKRPAEAVEVVSDAEAADWLQEQNQMKIKDIYKLKGRTRYWQLLAVQIKKQVGASDQPITRVNYNKTVINTYIIFVTKSKNSTQHCFSTNRIWSHRITNTCWLDFNKASYLNLVRILFQTSLKNFPNTTAYLSSRETDAVHFDSNIILMLINKRQKLGLPHTWTTWLISLLQKQLIWAFSEPRSLWLR